MAILLTTLLVALSATTLATPLPAYTPTPPTLPTSLSYRLYINVTDPSKDFPAPDSLQGLYVSTVRAGATLNAPPTTNLTSSASLFSTTTRQTTSLSRSLASNNPLGQYSFYLADAATPVALNPFVLELGVNAGNGTEGIYPSQNSCTRFATAKAGVFAVCDQKFDAYTHPRWLLVFVEGGEQNLPVTGECVAVDLVPECDGYVPEGGSAVGGEEIVETRCWTDVKSVTNWGEYGC